MPNQTDRRSLIINEKPHIHICVQYILFSSANLCVCVCVCVCHTLNRYHYMYNNQRKKTKEKKKNINWKTIFSFTLKINFTLLPLNLILFLFWGYLQSILLLFCVVGVWVPSLAYLLTYKYLYLKTIWW